MGNDATLAELRSRNRERIEAIRAGQRQAVADYAAAPTQPRAPLKPGTMQALLLQTAVSFGGREFTVEELTVAAYRRWPDTFGMDGFRFYPNLHSVMCSMSGPHGLVNRGYLVRVGPKRYKVAGGSP